MSTSSSSRSVTAIGGKAWATGPSGVSIEAIFEDLRDGITITSSPCLKMPPTTEPAKPR